MNQIDISYRRIGRIAGPVLITNFSYTAMGVIDTMMVGRLGVVALAGVGLGNMVAFSLLSFFWGSLSGVNTLVAQAVGARDRVAVGRVFFQGLYLALAGGAILTVSWPLLVGLIGWIGPTEGVEEIATDYMRIRLLGSWGVVLLWAADNFYRGLGRTTVTMWCGLVQLVLNCGLNYLLIFGKFRVPGDGGGWCCAGDGAGAALRRTPALRHGHLVRPGAPRVRHLEQLASAAGSLSSSAEAEPADRRSNLPRDGWGDGLHGDRSSARGCRNWRLPTRSSKPGVSPSWVPSR